MKELICILVLVVSMSTVISATEKAQRIPNHSESAVVLGMTPAEINSPAEGCQAEYSFTLMCPGCRTIMSAKFKKGYTSTTTTKCQKCGKKYIISYNWPGDRSEPTIREVKETR